MEENNMNDYLVNALYILSYLIIAAGIILPIFSFVKIMEDKYTSSHPELLIPPLYMGLLLVAIGGLGIMFSALIFNTKIKQEASEWQEKTMNVLGVIFIIIAIVGFFSAIEETNDSLFPSFVKAGIIGGIVFLVLNVQIGLLCIASVSTYKKYKHINIVKNITDKAEKFVFCQYCGNKIDLSENPEFCDKCGKKIEIS